MVPPSALVQAGDSNYVWRVKGGQLAKVPLTIGTRDERSGRWQVLSGLQAGDMVVRVPASGFKDGQKVELTAPKAVASASSGKVAEK
jgi:multidrug efflux pump subunit AcrA (membrane-fusion protein)